MSVDGCRTYSMNLRNGTLAELDIIYTAEVSSVWNHWWVLTIILCLFWMMVRWSRK